jgi:hypothetical protein
MSKPDLFIGSSSEGLQIAKAVQVELHTNANVEIWNQGLFGLGLSTLEGLVELLAKYDFAILVATPDDITISRRRQASTPRDNILVELGMFVARLGRERAFLLCDDSSKLRLPSDFAGISVAKYDHEFALKNSIAAVGPACTLIKLAMDRLGTIKMSAENYKQLLSELTDNDVRALLYLEKQNNTRPGEVYRHLAEKAGADFGALNNFAVRMVRLSQHGMIRMVGGSEVELSPSGRDFLKQARGAKEEKYRKLF